MHRVKNLNFSACLHELHSVFHVFFSFVDLHLLTRIEQMISRWKAAVNTQLSRVDRYFILAVILKLFNLKFIQCISWTSWCFHVELLWCIFVCNFPIHSLVLHKWFSFCTNPSHNNFLIFSDQGLELIMTKNLTLPFYFVFVILNTYHVVYELFPLL